jgi:hypothetical protein
MKALPTIERHDEWDSHTLVYIFQQLYAFFSRDTLHHHPVDTLSI